MDVNTYCNKINNHIIESAEKSIPKVIIKEGKHQELPKYIIKSIKLKSYWIRKYNITKNPIQLEKYKYLLNFTIFQIKKIGEEKWDNLAKN